MWHLDAAIAQCLRQGVVDLTRVIPVQARQVDQCLSVVSASDSVRGPQRHLVRGQDAQPLP